MSEAGIGILVFSTINVISAIVAHTFEPCFFRATLYSTLAATAIFHLAAVAHLGALDPLFPIAVLTGGVCSVVIAP